MSFLQLSSPIFFLLTILSAKELKFPPNFKFGVATSSYQIEGAWDEDGKGANIWDVKTHNNPSFTDDSNNADISCDSYHNIAEDIKIIKYLNVQTYRFSISWSRLLPDGTPNKINPKAVAYYNNLINELIANGIEPMVTLFHWDLPEVFVPLGAWSNPLIVPYFGEYARIAFRLFGDRVKTWLTFNEPRLICDLFKGTTGANYSHKYPFGIIEYYCIHHILLSHAEAYHIYDREFRSIQNGRIAITIDIVWTEPESSTPENEAMAEQRRQFDFGLYANPIFNFDYPDVVKQRIANRSKLEGYPFTRLPCFTQQEKLKIRGTADFLGINHYVVWLGKAAPEPNTNETSLDIDSGGERYFDPKWKSTAAPWIYHNPWAYRKLLNWIKNTYKNPEIIVTEIGFADGTEIMEDYDRITYLQDYLTETLHAIHEDGVKVSCFTAWSLMDNFEWVNGYTLKFGLFHVDFNSPERTRTPKKSAEFYSKLVASRTISP